MPDLDAYFTRTGYTGPRDPTLSALHAIVAAHAQTIPFENLDVLLGRPISLDSDAIFQKLIHDHRGGYCFEQNNLLLLVLKALGFRVTPLSGRIRLQRPREFTPPRTHLFVRVDLDDTTWLVDVGIGSLSLTSALRLDHDGEQSTPHEPRRIVQEGSLYFHQVRFDTTWLDVCEFTLEEMPPVDCELANWWMSTNPNAKTRLNLMVGRAASHGIRHTINNREFTTRAADGQATTRILTSPEDLLAVLAQTFGLHFPPATRFGPCGSLWPS